MKDETKVPLIFAVYPDFKDAYVAVVNNIICNTSVAIIHMCMNQCFEVITEHGTIFLENETESGDDNVNFRQNIVSGNGKSLSERFNGIAYEMSEKKREERKKKLLLKALWCLINIVQINL
eukprot:11316704-Ditylum_brightwellii.AAC.1